MLIQVVYLEIQPEKIEAFLTEALANAQASRGEAGVLQFDVLQQNDDPTRFMLYEVYRDEAALEAHRQTLHFQRWAERGVPLLTGERVRVLYREVT
ncbi:MAG: antibiotic biosynthesis monooxygenase [Anaerolineaceae bacterium]|nr:MAG: antibiotic biosynthesis monooxygenase [Anaerolineaceae bacterium]